MKKSVVILLSAFCLISMSACNSRYVRKNASSTKTSQVNDTAKSSDKKQNKEKTIEWSVSDIIKEPENKDFKFEKSGVREYLTYDEYLKEVERMSELKPKYTMVDDEEFSKGKAKLENVFNKVYQSIEEPKGEREGQEPTKDQDKLKRYAADYYSDLIVDARNNREIQFLIADYTWLDMEIDPNSIKIAKDTANQVKFELVLVNKTTKQQYYYVTGNFVVNPDIEFIDITGATLLTDGAVARYNLPQY
jgi:hypothetical protein